MPDKLIGALPPASGTNGNYYAIVSQDGKILQRVNLRDWPVSNPVSAAIATRVSPSELKTVNGNSLYGAGNVVISSDLAVWGSISGNYEDQSDLVAALSLRAAKGEDNTFTESNEFLGKTYGRWTDVAYAATFAFDANDQFQRIGSLTGNILFGEPLNSAAGEAEVVFVILIQDATGGRLASFDTTYFSAPGGVYPTLSTAPNKRDILAFLKLTTTRWCVLGLIDVPVL